MNYSKEELISQNYSYSRLDVFVKCPMKFSFKYIDKLRTECSSSAMDIGTICHEIMEDKFRYLKEGLDVDYLKLKEKFLFEIKKINYNDEYAEKLNNFINRIEKIEDDSKWKVLDVEQEINFVYNGYKMLAKIDRIDVDENGDFRVVDYKTNKKLFYDGDLKTSLQMYIYALAIKHKYGKFPIEFMYDMLFLNEVQYAMSKGWEKRGEKKLQEIFDNLILCLEVEEFYPKPSPLCYYCEYCKNNPNKDDFYGDVCRYFSKWTKDEKVFTVNEEWNGILQ